MMMIIIGMLIPAHCTCLYATAVISTRITSLTIITKISIASIVVYTSCESILNPHTHTHTHVFVVMVVKAVAASVNDSIALFVREASTGSAPICVTCGGRNAGKSQLARRLIADTLMAGSRGAAPQREDGNAVAYLETDCGQTQFSVPGVLGLYILRREQLQRDNGESMTSRSTVGAEQFVLPSGCHIAHENARFFGALSPKVREMVWT